MNHVQARNLLSLILNLTMALLVTVAISSFFVGDGLQYGAGNMDFGGFGCFIFFTNDSNVFAALCSLLLVPFNLKALISGKGELPKWASLLKFISTTAVTLTMMVSLLFLGPLMGYKVIFEGVCFSLHLVCPLISLVSFCVCEPGVNISGKQALLGMLPTVIYGTIYLIHVVFMGTWDDFYRFNIGGYWYISYLALLAVTCLFALAIRALHNLSGKMCTEHDAGTLPAA